LGEGVLVWTVEILVGLFFLVVPSFKSVLLCPEVDGCFEEFFVDDENSIV
ncbi:hypothetical protein L195_g034414, partial [Trifolium pratense]